LWIDRSTLEVRVADDGRGPDFEKIVNRAKEKGLLDEKRIHSINKKEALDLLFSPGFSTSDAADDLSGRGMGLDFIRASFNKFSGDIKALIPSGGGFALRGTLPLQVIALNVVEVTIGERLLFIPDSQFQILSSMPSGASLRQVLQLDQLQAPKTNIRWISVSDPVAQAVGESEGAGILAVDEVGTPTRKLFRALDPIWKSSGPIWIQSWMKACDGRALASRGPGKTLGLLADVGSLRCLSQTPRLSAPHKSL
jgi:hypothetical protein